MIEDEFDNQPNCEHKKLQCSCGRYFNFDAIVKIGEQRGRETEREEIFGKTKIKGFQNAKGLLNKFVLEQIKEQARQEGFKAGVEQERKALKANTTRDKRLVEKGFKEGQKSAIESYEKYKKPALIDAAKFQARQEALEEVLRILKEDSDTCADDITREHVHTKNFKKKIEALKKKEVKE